MPRAVVRPDMTTRRAFVGTAGLVGAGLLAGCTGGGESDGADTPTETGTETGSDGSDGETGDTRPRGTGGPAVTLESVDQRPSLPITPTVELLEPVATDDHPPRLRVTVENGSDRTLTLGEARAVLFEYVTADTGELILLPADGDYPAESGCWRLQEGIATTMEYRTVRLDPDESVSADLDLYGAPTDEDACLPVGSHGFESTYSVSEGGDATGTETGTGTAAGGGETETLEEGTWGFSLLLE